eukprot:SAG11_NODE_969_length_6347_cov_13.010871_2_plen_130_part_00
MHGQCTAAGLQLQLLHMPTSMPTAAFVLLAVLALQQLRPAACLQHAGMWGLQNGSEVTGPTADAVHEWTTLTFEVSDPAAIATNAALGVQALYPLSWTTSRKEKCMAPIPHTQVGQNARYVGACSGAHA